MDQPNTSSQEKYTTIDVLQGYNRWASRYDTTPNPLIYLEQKTTRKYLREIQGRQVLDIGCGTGRYCAWLAQQGAHVVGIDPSSNMLKEARKKITPECEFEVVQGSAHALKFPDNHFDLIISAFTMGHIEDIEPIFTEASRVLTPGGQMIISDFHPYWVVSGHNYSEFFDQSGRQYRIPIVPHLIEEYWRIFKKVNLSLCDLDEPHIGEKVLEKIPFAKHLKAIPMVLVFNLYNR